MASGAATSNNIAAAEAGISGDLDSQSNKALIIEQTMNYVLCSFMESIMFRAVVEEAAALTSITLFLGMIAIWAQVIAAM